MLHLSSYIGGEWRKSATDTTDINPSDLDDVVARVSLAGAGDVDVAVETARKAQRAWAKTGLEKRTAVLMKIGKALIDRAAELGKLLSREEGKTLPEGIGEVHRAGVTFQYYAAEVLRLAGDARPSVRDGIDVTVVREPIGVVAVISPWNFPIATATWKIAPALAFGNAVIWKPAIITPAIAAALAEIVSAQDVPAGLFSVVLGSGGAIGGHLAGHPGIDAISFTGSLGVGKQIAAAAGISLTRFQLELGSKNPLVVASDADLNIAVNAAVMGAFSGTGQKCTASSRIIVDAAIHDAFVEHFAAAARVYKVGHALAAGSQMGPLASGDQMETVQGYLELARQEGCEHVTGGERLDLATDGHYLSPAVFINGKSAMRTNQEEIFGPFACVIKVDSYEEGLAVANDTDFGLSASIITRSLARASHFRQHAEAGCVMVNLPTTGTDYHFPFSGRKQSSFGPGEQASAAREFYTQSKTSYMFAGKPE